MLFARPVHRAAAPMKQQFRRYATDPKPAATPSSGGSGSSGSNYLLYGVAAAAVAGGAYYFLGGSSTAAGVAQKAEAKVKQAAAAGAAGVGAGAPTDGAVKKALTGGDQGFISLKLEDVEIYNHNTKKFRFKLPEEDQVSGLQIASAILTKYQAPGAEKPTVRPYTPISDEDAKGYLDLLIKKYPNGPMSSHLHEMVPGQRLEVKGPLPKYPWSANKHDHIALVAGGTGITPMYQLMRAIFKNPEDKTKVTLVFGNISEEDILLKHELSELENTYPQRFRAFYVLDSPPKEWVGNKGFITKELLKTVLPEPKDGNIKVFVCGPPGLMKAISGDKKSPKDQGELVGILKELGYSPEQVYKF